MDIKNTLLEVTQKLQNKSPTSNLDSELLLMTALRVSRTYLYTYGERILSASEKQTLDDLCKRRINLEPMAYIIGTKEFWSREFDVSSATLIPRPETEMLVDEVLKLSTLDKSISILEMGTGSGAIAISLALERPRTSIVATDISSEALDLAKRNAKKFNANNIIFQNSDWFRELKKQKFDLIVSNPPYIESHDNCLLDLKFEPISALVSGEDGLDAIRHIAKNAKQFLKIDGTLLIEHGKDQEKAVNQIFKSNQWGKIKCLTDLRGFPRITVAK
jgi:release factor glutamine methyltransferase|tara:strand:- start:12242 stop:13066 length:825 start_codon:yes stop_codon:yes gene_type:complete